MKRNIKYIILYLYRKPFYTPDKADKLRIKFPGRESIGQNYSQCYQDVFALMVSNGKKGGRFLEIGSNHPFRFNNTALLEKNFGWTGYSIELNRVLVKKFTRSRSSRVIMADATRLDYDFLPDGDYDYLSVDCEPPENTFRALKRIPLNRCRFACITFEHDAYVNPHSKVRDEQRKYLESYGYKLTAGNISINRHYPFEDWWVNPALVPGSTIEKLIEQGSGPKRGEDYCLKCLQRV